VIVRCIDIGKIVDHVGRSILKANQNEVVFLKVNKYLGVFLKVNQIESVF
jgi:hypothetical protein